jgi:hypothetical protein
LIGSKTPVLVDENTLGALEDDIVVPLFTYLADSPVAVHNFHSRGDLLVERRTLQWSVDVEEKLQVLLGKGISHLGVSSHIEPLVTLQVGNPSEHLCDLFHSELLQIASQQTVVPGKGVTKLDRL